MNEPGCYSRLSVSKINLENISRNQLEGGNCCFQVDFRLGVLVAEDDDCFTFFEP